MKTDIKTKYRYYKLSAAIIVCTVLAGYIKWIDFKTNGRIETDFPAILAIVLFPFSSIFLIKCFIHALPESVALKFTSFTLRLWFSLIMIMIGCLVLIGLLLIVFQIVEFLKTGFWESISVNDSLIYFGSTWAEKPISWLGLWKIFEFMPASLALFLMAVTWYYLNVIILSKVSDKNLMT